MSNVGRDEGEADQRDAAMSLFTLREPAGDRSTRTEDEDKVKCCVCVNRLSNARVCRPFSCAFPRVVDGVEERIRGFTATGLNYTKPPDLATSVAWPYCCWTAIVPRVSKGATSDKFDKFPGRKNASEWTEPLAEARLLR